MNPLPNDRTAGASPADEAARLQPLFARRVTARLSQGLAELPPGVDERLRFAREQALAHARHRATAEPAVAWSGGAASIGPPPRPLWARAGAWVPAALIVLGLWAIGEHRDYRRNSAVAEVDARLLSDVLPPTAYTDPGFEAFLQWGEPR
jgi:hypothetical protein